MRDRQKQTPFGERLAHVRKARAAYKQLPTKPPSRILGKNFSGPDQPLRSSRQHLPPGASLQLAFGKTSHIPHAWQNKTFSGRGSKSFFTTKALPLRSSSRQNLPPGDILVNDWAWRRPIDTVTPLTTANGGFSGVSAHQKNTQ